MNGEAIATLVGAVVGSALTFALSQWASIGAKKKELQTRVLIALVGGRGRIFSTEVSDYINIIPVAFANNHAVRSAYQHFCAVRPEDRDIFYSRYREMVREIAKAQGYSSVLSDADINLGFYPLPLLLAIHMRRPLSLSGEIKNATRIKAGSRYYSRCDYQRGKILQRVFLQHWRIR